MKLQWLYCAFFTFFIFSCGVDDDNEEPETTDTTPTTATSINASDQIISQNRLLVTKIEIPVNGWLAANAITNAGEIMPDSFVAEARYLTPGTYFNRSILIDDPSLQEGKKYGLGLHRDNGNLIFNEDSISELDPPLQKNGMPVGQTISLFSPILKVDNQSVNGDSMLVATSENVVPVWLVSYLTLPTDQPDYNQPIGGIYLPSGRYEQLPIFIDSSRTYLPGLRITTVMHLDDNANRQFDFLDSMQADVPEYFGYGSDREIVRTFVVQ
jgi:hypothetical protein